MPFNVQIDTRRVSNRRQNKTVTAPPDEDQTLWDEYQKSKELSRVLVYLQDQDEDVVPSIEFGWFQDFPIEVQEEIFKYALPGPRTIEFFPGKVPDEAARAYLGDVGDRDNNRYILSQLKTSLVVTIPALLQVNRHSRQWARKFYQPCFDDYLENKRSVYIDFSADTVIMKLEGYLANRGIATRSGVRVYGKHYLDQIQSLAFFRGLRAEDYYLKYYLAPTLKTFSGLRKVTFLQEGDINYKVRQIQDLEDWWAVESTKKKEAEGRKKKNAGAKKKRCAEAKQKRSGKPKGMEDGESEEKEDGELKEKKKEIPRLEVRAISQNEFIQEFHYDD